MTSKAAPIANINGISSIIPGVTRMQDVDGFIGTIVYVGPVASAKDDTEQYAGIIWDDPSRGKHDGSVVCRKTNQLVRHFFCPHPCGASFVRLKKLDLGVALDDTVLRSKYVTAEAPMVAPNNILPHTARTSGGREKPIEFHGEMKIRSQQQLEDLNSISLRRMGISRYDNDNNSNRPLNNNFQHLTTLDLAGNLLSDWDTVLNIMRQFPNLTNLSVAANRLQNPSRDLQRLALEQDAPTAPFSSLQILNLNQCGISSVEILVWIGTLFPKLQDLCISHSDLSNLTTSSHPMMTDGSIFQKLRVLDCSDCRLSSWNDQIVPLCSRLPCLQQLSLDENPIDTTNFLRTIVEDNNNNNKAPSVLYFSELTSLQLAGTQIEQWQDLDGLLSLPQLTSLRFRRCPLLSSMGTGEARALTIARLGNLTKLNASEISTKERLEAERRYVSSVACELLQLSQQAGESDEDKAIARRDILKQHPQFELLMEKHKDFIASRVHTMDSSPRSVASPGGGSSSHSSASVVVVNVSIQSMAASSCHMEPLVRRLPGSLSIKRLKAMCSRSFGLDPDLQRLHFCTEYDAFPTELDDEAHTLAYYGVSDGATIFMNEIDLEALQREENNNKKQLEANLKEQEALEMQKQKHKKQLLLN